MTVEIRRANTDDAAPCAAIVNDWIDAKNWLPRQHSRKAIEEVIRASIPLREVWVAGDPIQGYLSLNTEERQIMGLYGQH